MSHLARVRFLFLLVSIEYSICHALSFPALRAQHSPNIVCPSHARKLKIAFMFECNPLRLGVSAKHKQTGKNRIAENSRVCVGMRECDQAEVAQPVELQQHMRWRSPEGTASQVEESPLYCMSLLEAGRMTDGFSVSG